MDYTTTRCYRLILIPPTVGSVARSTRFHLRRFKLIILRGRPSSTFDISAILFVRTDLETVAMCYFPWFFSSMSCTLPVQADIIVHTRFTSFQYVGVWMITIDGSIRSVFFFENVFVLSWVCSRWPRKTSILSAAIIKFSLWHDNSTKKKCS